MSEDVLRDIEAWWPKIKSGGVLGGHNYQWAGVKQVVDDFVEDNVIILFLGKGRQCWKVIKE